MDPGDQLRQHPTSRLLMHLTEFEGYVAGSRVMEESMGSQTNGKTSFLCPEGAVLALTPEPPVLQAGAS